MSEKRGIHTAPTPLATGRKLGLFSGSIRPSFVLSHNMPIINATDKLASFWRFSVTPSSISSHSQATDYWPLTTGHCSPAPRPTLHGKPAGFRSCADPPPLATACHRPPNCQKPNGPDLDEHPLYIQYATEPDDFYGQNNLFLSTRRRSPVDRSLVAGGAPRQRLEACLPDAHQPQCLFSRCSP